MTALLLRLLPYVLSGAVAIGSAWTVYDFVWSRGKAACQAEAAVATAKQAAEHAARLRGALALGDALSEKLAKKERALSALTQEYTIYANAITGNCPASLGVLVGAASAASAVPPTPGTSFDPPAAVAAAPLAANIATNYARAWDCIARYNALLDWHAGLVKEEK